MLMAIVLGCIVVGVAVAATGIAFDEGWMTLLGVVLLLVCSYISFTFL